MSLFCFPAFIPHRTVNSGLSRLRLQRSHRHDGGKRQSGAEDSGRRPLKRACACDRAVRTLPYFSRRAERSGGSGGCDDGTNRTGDAAAKLPSTAAQQWGRRCSWFNRSFTQHSSCKAIEEVHQRQKRRRAVPGGKPITSWPAPFCGTAFEQRQFITTPLQLTRQGRGLRKNPEYLRCRSSSTAVLLLLCMTRADSLVRRDLVLTVAE